MSHYSAQFALAITTTLCQECLREITTEGFKITHSTSCPCELRRNSPCSTVRSYGSNIYILQCSEMNTVSGRHYPASNPADVYVRSVVIIFYIRPCRTHGTAWVPSQKAWGVLGGVEYINLRENAPCRKIQKNTLLDTICLDWIPPKNSANWRPIREAICTKKQMSCRQLF